MFVPLTPIRFLYRAVDLFGKKVGVVSGDRQFTYKQFGERCELLASALSRAGIQAGDRVAYLSFNTHQLLEGYFGVVMSGAVVIPLNVRLSALEFTNILNHSGARIVFSEPNFAELIEQLRAVCPAVEHFIHLDSAYAAFLSRVIARRRAFMTHTDQSPA